MLVAVWQKGKSPTALLRKFESEADYKKWRRAKNELTKSDLMWSVYLNTENFIERQKKKGRKYIDLTERKTSEIVKTLETLKEEEAERLESL